MYTVEKTEKVTFEDVALRLKPHALNLQLRAGQDTSKEDKALADNIAQMGYDMQQPIVVDAETNTITSGHRRQTAIKMLYASDGMRYAKHEAMVQYRHYVTADDVTRDLIASNPIESGAGARLLPPLHCRVRLALTQMHVEQVPYTVTQVAQLCGCTAYKGSEPEFLRGYCNLALVAGLTEPTAASFDGATAEPIRKFLTGKIGDEKLPQGGLLSQYKDAVARGDRDAVEAIKVRFLAEEKDNWPAARMGISPRETPEAKEARIKAEYRNALTATAPCTAYAMAIRGDKLSSTHYAILDAVAKLDDADAKTLYDHPLVVANRPKSMQEATAQGVAQLGKPKSVAAGKPSRK